MRLVAVLEGGKVQQAAALEVQLDRVRDEVEDGVSAALDRRDAAQRQLRVRVRVRFRVRVRVRVWVRVPVRVPVRVRCRV